MDGAFNDSAILHFWSEYARAQVASDRGDYEQARLILREVFLIPDVPAPIRFETYVHAAADLAGKHPPVRDDLVRLRDHAAKAVFDGQRDASALSAVITIDNRIGQVGPCYRLLLHLDARAPELLVACRDQVVQQFMESGDIRRARKYLGDYEEFIESAAMLQNQACKMRARGAADLAWLLSDAERYARYVCMAESVLRASGEDACASHLRKLSLELLADRDYRRLIAREESDPGICERELRAATSRPGNMAPLAGVRMG